VAKQSEPVAKRSEPVAKQSEAAAKQSEPINWDKPIKVVIQRPKHVIEAERQRMREAIFLYQHVLYKYPSPDEAEPEENKKPTGLNKDDKS
jgi:hypothetical protein